MADRMVTIYVDDYPRRCRESKIPKVLENIENLKQMYRAKGVSEELLDKLYGNIRIVPDPEDEKD